MSKCELSNLHVHWPETGGALNHVKLNIMATYRLHLPASRNSAQGPVSRKFRNFSDDKNLFVSSIGTRFVL